MKRVYISGPMTGLPGLNFPAFHAAASDLRAQGLDVVNPADFGADDGLAWADYLRMDIRALVDCDAVHMLPGWRGSKGARLEHHIAVELGFTVTGAEA